MVDIESNKLKVKVGSTENEQNGHINMTNKLRSVDIPNSELLSNLGLFLNRQTLSRILFIQSLYEKIIPIHGVIVEFGVRWGQNLSLLSNFRGMYEPYNYNRKIIGFDTFSGFPSISDEDGTDNQVGEYGVTENWVDELNSILEYHESNSPIAHKKKFELIKGDASVTINRYLSENPETIISLVYFDFDLYKPTRDCLEAILPHLTKGSILAFDELNCSDFPGETIALKEVFGLSKYSIRRDPNSPLTSYLVID